MAVRSGALLTFWERPGIRRIHGGSNPRYILTLEAGRRRARIGMGAGNAPRPPRSRGEGRARSCVPDSLGPAPACRPDLHDDFSSAGMFACTPRSTCPHLGHATRTPAERSQNAPTSLPGHAQITPRSSQISILKAQGFRSECIRLQMGSPKAPDLKA